MGLHEAELVRGDVVCLRPLCIPCTRELVAELRLCCVGLISRLLWVQSRGRWSSSSWSSLDTNLWIQVQGALLERAQCPCPSKLHFAVVTCIGEISSAHIVDFPVLCLEFFRENLGWLLLGWFQGSCQKSALNKDHQLGPGEPQWATNCYVMLRKSLQPNQKHIGYKALLFALCQHYSHAMKTTERWQEGKILSFVLSPFS